MPSAEQIDKLRVAIVYGGQSAEHEISILSAQYVLRALDRSRFEPILFGIDRTGVWLKQTEAALLQASRDPKRVGLDRGPSVNPLLLRQPSAEAGTTAQRGIDVVFPVLHGTRGEDGAIQGLLEIASLPYVGAGVLGSALGMDKDVMKRLLIEAGIPVARFMTFRRSEFDRQPVAMCRKAACLGFPQFVKPANLGSSVGISKVADRRQLRTALLHAFEFDEKVIIEEAAVGRELECAVLGGDSPIASVAGEVIVLSPDGFYSYAAKYLDDTGAALQIPARLDRTTMARVRRLAVRTFQTLECHGLARVDFFLTTSGVLLVNEINTLPGFTAMSMYPKLWEQSGMSGTKLTARLIELALERHRRKEALALSREGSNRIQGTQCV